MLNYMIVSLAVAFAVHWFKRISKSVVSLALPPGPKGIPYLGNVFDLAVDSDNVWIKYQRWSKRYGDVMTVSMFGHTSIILGSTEATNDLLEQRSSNYSDRPDMPMLVDLMGWDWTFALMRYGPRWREYRRVFHHHFQTTKVEHQRIAQGCVHPLLHSLADTPVEFLGHLKHFTASIIMKRVYGYSVTDKNDFYITLLDQASKSTSLAAIPGAFLVDIFPRMKYIPEWAPWGGFKRQARDWRKLSEAVVELPFQMVKDEFAAGNATTCFVSDCLEQNFNAKDQGVLQEDVIKHIAAVSYAAGADTTLATLSVFMLAMTCHMDVLKRAQTDLDAVLGSERLPNFEDRDQLPYIGAILKEVMRWIPVLPLAVPHRSVNADTYRGFYIPAGANIVPNVWAILHNEEVFSNPSDFTPERFLDNPSLPDPADIGFFGFGRRACTGKTMALDTLWIAIASILAIFDISKATDEEGNEITPEAKLAPGSVRWQKQRFGK